MHYCTLLSYAVVTTTNRLRLDGRSKDVRLFVKGRKSHSNRNVTR